MNVLEKPFRKKFDTKNKKNKPTNVGRIALERQAGEKIDPPRFEPLISRFITICTVDCAIWALFFLCCKRLYISNKLYIGVRAIEITQK